MNRGRSVQTVIVCTWNTETSPISRIVEARSSVLARAKPFEVIIIEGLTIYRALELVLN